MTHPFRCASCSAWQLGDLPDGDLLSTGHWTHRISLCKWSTFCSTSPNIPFYLKRFILEAVLSSYHQAPEIWFFCNFYFKDDHSKMDSGEEYRSMTFNTCDTHTNQDTEQFQSPPKLFCAAPLYSHHSLPMMSTDLSPSLQFCHCEDSKQMQSYSMQSFESGFFRSA